MELEDLAANNWDDIYTELARQLFEGEDLNTDAVYNRTAAQLIKAVNNGLGPSFDDDESRKALKDAFILNVEQFSYAKTLTQFNLFKDAVFNTKGQQRSFESIKKTVADTGEVFNKSYLSAEVKHVTQSSIMARKWHTMDAEYLQFSTVGDSLVRPEHRIFDKFTALKTDKIWLRLYTPLAWGCRCTVIPGIARNLSKEYNSEWANTVVDPLVKDTIFDNNAALSNVIFNDKHPYFKAKEQEKIKATKEPKKESEPSTKPFEIDNKTLKEFKNRKIEIKDFDGGKKFFNDNFKGLDLLKIDKELEVILKKHDVELNHKSILLTDGRITFRYSAKGGRLELVRVFDIQDNLKTVTHDFFTLDDKLQGKGISKQIFKEFQNQYKSCGMEQIKVHANLDVGGYTWAKYGFHATDKYKMETILVRAERMEKSGRIKSKDLKHFKDTYNKFYEKVDQESGFPMHQIANTKYGKTLLLGSDWYGKIDLKNKDQLKMYEDYLGRN